MAELEFELMRAPRSRCPGQQPFLRNMLWRILAFAPCLCAQERGPYLPPPSDLSHANATYESLMLRWARASSSVHRCLEAQARQPPHSLMRVRGSFWTIGVEGAGHHMIEAMHPSLCKSATGAAFKKGSNGPEHCGGQMSFPSGFVWRRSATISPASQQRSCASLAAAAGADGKFIFLLRDPVDATISALGRFWKHTEGGNDTLIAELTAARLGWRHVVECLRKLPCERSLILSPCTQLQPFMLTPTPTLTRNQKP